MNRAWLLFILLIATALTACAERAPEQSTPNSGASTHTVGEGETRTTLRISATEITTAGRITVELTARDNTQNTDLAEEPAFEGWTIDNAERDAITGSWTWTLEPFLDGDYTIEPISLAFGEGDNTQTVSTPSVPIIVRSVLEEGDEEIAGVKGIVDAPPPDRIWIITMLAGISATVVGGCIGFVLMLTAKARQKYERRAPAHELALARLDAALAADEGGVEGAVMRLSDVVRLYIEDRYSVRAPEQTTEEFLAESRSSMRFHEDDVALLGRFLTTVDLIKFAGASANDTQASEAAAALREFIRATASTEQTIVVSEAEAKTLHALQTQRVRAGYEFAEPGGSP